MENWKPIINFEGLYEVSDLGRIRNIKTGRVLKACPERHGYLSLSVYPKGRERKHFKPAREVANAFIGPRPKGYQINHKNGIKTDNRAENLEYVTPSQNLKHAVKLGLKKPNSGCFPRKNKKES